MERICTNIEQSKKLIELGLGHETADMVHIVKRHDCREPWELAAETGNVYTYLKDSVTMCLSDYAIPAWSLTALLGVIPKHIKNYNVLRIDVSDNDFAIWYDEIGYGVNNDLPNITMESAVDACYEMVCWLKENGKI